MNKYLTAIYHHDDRSLDYCLNSFREASSQRELDHALRAVLLDESFFSVHEKLYICQKLLGAGANTSIHDYDHLPVTHSLAQQKQTEMLELLMNFGADVNAVDELFNSLLHVLVKENKSGMLGLAIQMGATSNVVNHENITPLMLAAELGHVECARLLLLTANVNQRVMSTAIHIAAYTNNLDVMKLLIEAGADVNITDTEGRTPLMWALTSFKLDAALHLVKNCNIDYSIQTKNGDTAVHLLMRKFDVSADDVLHAAIKNGADVNALNDVNETPLMKAINAKMPGPIRILLQANCQGDGMELMELAHSRCNDSVMLMLQSAGNLHGYKFSSNFPSVLPLKQLCRKCIRKVFVLGSWTMIKMPLSLQEFLSLKELDAIIV